MFGGRSPPRRRATPGSTSLRPASTLEGKIFVTQVKKQIGKSKFEQRNTQGIVNQKQIGSSQFESQRNRQGLVNLNLNEQNTPPTPGSASLRFSSLPRQSSRGGRQKSVSPQGQWFSKVKTAHFTRPPLWRGWYCFDAILLSQMQGGCEGRGGLVYHSTPGSRVVRKKKKRVGAATCREVHRGICIIHIYIYTYTYIYIYINIYIHMYIYK